LEAHLALKSFFAFEFPKDFPRRKRNSLFCLPVNELSKALLYWFEKNKRDLPWRQNANPYAIWISEVMLQQTQVETVLPYFKRFLKRFPNVEILSSASLEEVLKYWEGLGYYSRARHLHSAAKEIRGRYAGELPRDYEHLRALPGIGEYTASAIVSIAFNQPFPVVDGNVHRVFSRVLAIAEPKEVSKKKIYSFLKKIIPHENPSSFNQAIMELGALVCLPKNPKCSLCPIQDFCKAFQEKRVEDFPMKSPKKNLPHENWIVLAVKKKKEVLLRQRPLEGLWGGLWELPMFKKEGKSLDAKPLCKQLGIKGKLIKLKSVKHTFSHFKVTLHPFWIEVEEDFFPSKKYVWEDLFFPTKPLPAPHLKILKLLQATESLRSPISFKATRAK
jgi:A/G-specific adenine glycosylase